MPPIPLRKSFRTWSEHKADWKTCTRCFLHETRKNVVLARGQLPCDILFIAEAPGESEDVIGVPMVGPAGKLMDNIVESALKEQQYGREATGLPKLRVAFTNVISCIPRTGEGGKAKDPEPECIEACQPRLVEMVCIANPKLIVLVGSTAERNATLTYPGIKPVYVNVIHPAAILRANLASRGLMVQQASVRIEDAVGRVFGN